jgi:hypothetical protein
MLLTGVEDYHLLYKLALMHHGYLHESSGTERMFWYVDKVSYYNTVSVIQ